MAEYDSKAAPPDEPDAKKPKAKDKDAQEICKTALERWNRWWEREQHNVNAAYEDLAFCWNDEQWPADVAKEREHEKRPMLTANQLPQFVHQITGDMRQMRPAIRVVPVDDRGDKDTAETNAGLIRYIENRSDASAAYMSGADTQVAAGIGHWRVTKEYADDTTFNQEIRITGVDDGIAVAWDPDASLPTREDAKWCIVPVDMSVESFKEQYPDAPVEDFSDLNGADIVGWFDKDFVRVAEYWVKKPSKRTLALYPNGSIVDLTDGDPEKLAQAQATKARIEARDSYKVCRYLITAAHVLEGPIDWPGRYIPIVPVLGEEIRIGRKVVRRGIVRAAKDTQRMFNYFVTAHTEVVGLQPKAPFIGTEKNFEKYQDDWAQANNKAFPFLPYTPDGTNGGAPPQRVQPPVSSQGITEGLALSNENLRRIIGIYDASLGAKSNETSGKAILARQREGDTGTFVYIDNWTRAIKHTGKLLIDLIPHVYDTERKIRIMGEDGKVDLKDINKPVGMIEMDPETGEPKTVQKIENDVTVGAYDVVLDTGPSYTTKREEAKEGMIEFIRSAPDVAPVVMDLVAKAQDWPLADEFARRLETIAPPPVQEMINRQKGESGEETPPPKEPTPAEQMQFAAAQEQLKGLALDNKKKEVEIAGLVQTLQAGGSPAEAPDPLLPAKIEGLQSQNAINVEKGKREIVILDQTIEMNNIKISQMSVDTVGKQMGLQHKDEEHGLKMTQGATGIAHQQEAHRAGMAEKVTGLMHGQEQHEMSKEGHEMKIKQMKAPKPDRPSAR
jgi:hypothetical protein